MSFDRATGDLWVGDVGWEQWELIFRVERGGNYGWSIREGRQSVRPEGRLGPTPILPPMVDHPHSEAASITGGYVYRGSRLKDLVGTYVYGDYQSGKVWGLKHDGRRVTWRGLAGRHGAPARLLRRRQRRGAVPGRARAHEPGLSPGPQPGRDRRSGSRLPPDPEPDRPVRLDPRRSRPRRVSCRTGSTPKPGPTAPAPSGSWRSPATAGSRWTRTASGSCPKARCWPGPCRSTSGRATHRPRARGGSRPRSSTVREGAGGRIPTSGITTRPTRPWSRPGARAGRCRYPMAARRAAGSTLAYRFAARSECVLCHNPWIEARTTVFGVQSASPLALGAAQLDRDVPGARTEREPAPPARAARLLRPAAPGIAERGGPRLADPYDEEAGLDARARAYLQVNCAHCHSQDAGGIGRDRARRHAHARRDPDRRRSAASRGRSGSTTPGSSPRASPSGRSSTTGSPRRAPGGCPGSAPSASTSAGCG